MYQALDLTGHAGKNEAVRVTVLELLHFSEIATDEERTQLKIEDTEYQCCMPDN